MNKKTLSCFPYPWILSWIQIAVGAVFMLIMWRLNVFKPPEGGFTKEKMKALVLPSIMHLIAHVSACASYNLASVSFMQVVKAAEPACSVLLLSLFFGKRYTKLVWLTLIPIVGGVMAGSASEVNFSMAAFLLAMTSNVTSALRAVYSKDIQEKGGLRGINLYGGIAIVSAIIQLPLSLIMEGTKLPAAFAAAPALMADKGILLFGAFSVPFIVYLTVGSMFYHLYNQTAYQALAELSPLSHSVANTVKRVVIIIASIAVFRNPISTQGAVAAAIAIAGTCLYSIAQQKAKDDAAKAAAAAA
jgi:solute carrier family 35 protein E1|tara:strand:+ start:1215 stop:2120 length:906 start_codon:yes stop_codon:yes gene_type:complete|mmetsp:Transcript_3832/g.13236  ORF Transcript_3832/g.13236 Transcript_3832/m.13236 type:complete len:302 (+) Transcript_3832:1513-2418(+)